MIGTMVAGSDETVTRIMREVLGSGEAELTILLGKGRARAPDAALDQRRRGACARLRRCGAVAAIPRRCWCRRSWRKAKRWASPASDMIAAYVAGYEAWAELLSRERPPITSRAGTRPASSARSARARRAPRCDGSTPSKAAHGDRARGLAKRRAHGQFRHDDEAVPCRHARPCRPARGARLRRPASRPRPTRWSTRRASCRRCRRGPRPTPSAT